MTDREVMQQALEALKKATKHLPVHFDSHFEAIAALRAQLEQPDRQSLQAAGTHPAPCARYCEAKAYELEIRGLKSALRAALEQPEQEPVAYFDFQQLKFTWAKHMKIGPVPVSIKVEPLKLYTIPPQRKPFDILAITTAYEQGVGKGHQAQGRSVEIENPYAPGDCQQAWALGYDEGKKQAASKDAHGIGEKP